MYMGSIYRVPDDAKDDKRIYGLFPGCSIMGSSCAIRCTRLEDYSPKAIDIFGFPSFKRGGLAIHISGLNDYGERTGASLIMAIAMMKVVWEFPDQQHASGLGCDKPEAVVILKEAGWCHHAHYHRSESYVTLEGIYRWDADRQSTFAARDIIDHLNAVRKRTFTYDEQHRLAIGRLLRDSLEVTNHGILNDEGMIGCARLVRSGRHGYKWVRR